MIFMVATTTASTPSPTVAWNNQYSGAASYTVAKAVNQTTDGNYVIVGVTNGDDNMEAQFKYHYNIYLAGIDSGGNELWHNFYGMTGQPGDSNYETSSGNDVRQTSDG
ncbi:MAG TPA: hypothetical protein VK436_06510, partial [Methanocella sp.]|nr:hypothetical protein [Methanocella sp.]